MSDISQLYSLFQIITHHFLLLKINQNLLFLSSSDLIYGKNKRNVTTQNLP